MDVGNGGAIKNFNNEIFEELVEDKGINNISEKINAGKSEIKYWMEGEHKPSVRHVKKMIENIEDERVLGLLKYEGRG